VAEQGAAQVEIDLDATRFRRAPHKNKFGKDYPAGERY
jgi:hypothetical protein